LALVVITSGGQVSKVIRMSSPPTPGPRSFPTDRRTS
jgi:hypothetical protein